MHRRKRGFHKHLAELLVVALGLLIAAPGVGAASDYVRLAIPGITSGTVTVTDTTYGTVATATYDATSGGWDAALTHPSDPLLVTVSQSVYENVYDALVVPANGTTSTSGGKTYYELSTPVTLPTQQPAGVSFSFSNVSATGASVTASVYAGSSGNPVSNAGLYLSTPTSGASLAAVGSNAVTVSGSVYGSSDAMGDVMATLTGTSGSTVTVAVYYNGSTLGSATVTLTSSGAATSSGGTTTTTSATSVGSAGGTLASSDGTFSLNVPAGVVPAGETLSLTESAVPPAGAPALPTGFQAASSYFSLALSGSTPLTQALTAQLKYTASALGSLPYQRLSAFHDGIWQFAPTSVDSTTGQASFKVSGPETVVAFVNSRKFSDIPSGYWATTYIDTLLGANVINGFPDGTFQPDGSLTRAQFTKMIVVTAGLAPSSATTTFTDVPADAWYAPYVAAAQQAGIVNGMSPTTFAPNATLTREQMAAMLARALKLTGTATLSFTDDSSIDAWATSAIQAAVKAGYLAGFPDGSFQPHGTSTRAQASKVLAIAIGNMAP